MSRLQDALRAAVFAGGVALFVGAFAPSSVGFQRPPPAKDTGTPEIHVGCLGYGKGEIRLPTLAENGRMCGHLLDCEGGLRFKLEAMLTGCMPDALVQTPGYKFGGLYGKVWRLGDIEPGSGPATFGIEGTWQSPGGGEGTFRADALAFNESGRMEVVGTIYGKFTTHAERPLGASLAFSNPQVPGKGVLHDSASQPPPSEPYGDSASVPRKDYPKTPYGDARSATDPYGDSGSVPRKKYPKTPYGDARSATDPYGDSGSEPHKGYPKTPYDQSFGKPIDRPWGDSGSVPRKEYPKTPFGDAVSGPTPVQVGLFYLRFRFAV